MSGLHLWLEREARRLRTRARLPAALLLDRGMAYACARLGPVWLGLGLRTALHAAELYLLSWAIPYEYLAPLFAYRTLVSMAASAHWGALEPLRHAVRAHMQARQLRAARARIERALSLTLLLGSVPLLAASLYISRELRLGRGLSLFDAYAWACALRLLTEAYARAFHAGVYASRRVYRPLWSFAAGDALSLSLIVLGFDALGAFCVPTAISASALVDAALSLRAAGAAYRLTRLSSPRPRLHGLRPAPTLTAAGGVLMPALANLSLQLDALVLLALVALPHAHRFVAFYYVLRPLLGVSSQWARVFYFDVSRLESGAMGALRGHLRRYLRRVSLGCACLLSALCALAAVAYGRVGSVVALGSLIAFVWARAWFSPVQLEAFVQRRYGLLLCTTLTFAALLSAAAAWQISAAFLVALAALLLLTAAAVLPAPLSAPSSPERVCSVPQWLERLRGRAPVQLAVLRIARTGVAAGRVQETLAAADPGWSVALLGRSHLLLLAAGERTLTASQLVAAGAGLIEALQFTQRAPACEQLAHALRDGLLPPDLSRALCAEAPTQAELCEVFHRCAPGGHVLDLHSGSGRLRALAFSASELAALTSQVIEACARADHRPRRNRLPFQLAVFAPRGHARCVFVAPKGSAAFPAFRAQVRAATWRASAFDESVSHTQHDRAAGEGAFARAWRLARSLQRRLHTHDV